MLCPRAPYSPLVTMGMRAAQTNNARQRLAATFVENQDLGVGRGGAATTQDLARMLLAARMSCALDSARAKQLLSDSEAVALRPGAGALAAPACLLGFPRQVLLPGCVLRAGMRLPNTTTCMMMPRLQAPFKGESTLWNPLCYTERGLHVAVGVVQERNSQALAPSYTEDEFEYRGTHHRSC